MRNEKRKGDKGQKESSHYVFIYRSYNVFFSLIALPPTLVCTATIPPCLRRRSILSR